MQGRLTYLEGGPKRWRRKPLTKGYRAAAKLNRKKFSGHKTLGFSHRDMDFIQGLRWSLEEVSRVYGVPKPLLSDLERATFSNINAAERIFWRNTMIPEMGFLEEQLNRILLPRFGYSGLAVKFDITAIEALREDENSRVSREGQLLDRGVLTINEVRRTRNLPDVPWGDSWAKAPASRPASLDEEPALRSHLSLAAPNGNGAAAPGRGGGPLV